jgi:hypothetical protein
MEKTRVCILYLNWFMKHTIQIPKPCSASWDEMTPAENGRHCTACCKTVVDFTNWHEDDVLQYLQQQGSMRVCGRFREEQVSVPVSNEEFVQTVVRIRMPLYKKIAAIFLFAFGLLQVGPETASAQKTGKVCVVPDTSSTHYKIMGAIGPSQPDTIKAHKPPKTNDNKHLMGKPTLKKPEHENRNMIQGDVYYAPAEVQKNENTTTGGVVGTPVAPVTK